MTPDAVSPHSMPWDEPSRLAFYGVDPDSYGNRQRREHADTTGETPWLATGLALIARHDNGMESGQTVWADDMVQKVLDALDDPHITEVVIVRTGSAGGSR